MVHTDATNAGENTNHVTKDALGTQGRQGTSIGTESSEDTHGITREPPNIPREDGLDGSHTTHGSNIPDNFKRVNDNFGHVRQTTVNSDQTSDQAEQNPASSSVSQGRRRTTLSAFSNRWSAKPRATPKPEADISTGNGEYPLCMWMARVHAF